MARSLALALGAALALPRAAGVVLRDAEPEDVQLARLWLSPPGQKNDVKTVIFIAGVEGAGHHFIHSLTDAAIHKQHKNVSRVWLPKAFTCGEEWKPEGIGALAEKIRALPMGNTYILEDIRSYPECGVFKGYVEHEERKMLYHPHLDWLKQAIQKAGAQLRVIFLYREMEDCLAASCLHRKIDYDCPSEADVLRQNAIFLASDLHKLDPMEVSCMEYGNMDTMIHAVQDAFGKEIMSETLIQEIWKDGEGAEDMRLFQDRWFKTVDHMKLGGSALKGLCRSFRKLSMKGLARLFDNSTDTSGAVMLERKA